MEHTEAAVVPETPVTTDPSFPDQCIDLLCQQEKTLWLLGQANEKARNDESLDLILQMLIQFLDFAENHLSSDEFNSVAERLHAVHSHTADHKQKLKTHSWKVVRSIVGLESPGEKDIRRSYQELGQKHLEMFEAFFQVCHQKIPAGSSQKETFDAAANVFLDELKERW